MTSQSEVERIADAWAFCRAETGSLADRALALALSMAAVKCKNMYPVGVIGGEARAHYTEARRIAASAIEARRAAAPQSDAVADESAVGVSPDAEPSPEPSPHLLGGK